MNNLLIVPITDLQSSQRRFSLFDFIFVVLFLLSYEYLATHWFEVLKSLNKISRNLYQSKEKK